MGLTFEYASVWQKFQNSFERRKGLSIGEKDKSDILGWEL
jgi:hypothetical protein